MKLVNGLSPSWIERDGARFHIKPLTQLGLIDVQNEIQARGKSVSVSARGIELILDECLQTWEGVTDEDGTPMACNAENKRALPAVAMAFIASQVYRLSVLSEEQRKNS